MTREPVVVCLGYPALLEERFVARTRAVDPRIEVVRLPADPDGAWLRESVERPHDEPPPWALGCAAERRVHSERHPVDQLRHKWRLRAHGGAQCGEQCAAQSGE